MCRLRDNPGGPTYSPQRLTGPKLLTANGFEEQIRTPRADTELQPTFHQMKSEYFVMNTHHSLDVTAPTANRKTSRKRALITAVLAGSLALTGLGFASGTAQAQRPHYECEGHECR